VRKYGRQWVKPRKVAGNGAAGGGRDGGVLNGGWERMGLRFSGVVKNREEGSETRG
jgi:hypothetical protein